ncbi:sulfurtransferase [Dermabacteraceae bacterium CCM 9520]
MSQIPPIVDYEWCAAQTGRPLRYADVRWSLARPDGRADYLAGHIPGAVYVDLETQLTDPPSPQRGRHPLPQPTLFAQAMRELGICDDTLVVAYDDCGGLSAARLVWLLRACGHPAALLADGLRGYPGELESGSVEVATAEFTASPWPPSLLADVSEVAEVSQNGGSKGKRRLIDSRAEERYRGEHEPVDARAGHIPGAINAPVTEKLSGKKASALQKRFHKAGLVEGETPLVYCGSGVTACLNLLLLEKAGWHGRLYPGSFSQWAADPAREVEVG